jgi:prepilin-type N-terminal cleavage/methylation domain-containing protein
MKTKNYNSAGFTLLELLTVMAIIGVISSIAVPQYLRYKQRAFDVRAQSDLLHIAAAEEAHFIEEESYLSCTNADCTRLPGIATLSQGVELTVTATEGGFLGEASHPKGSGKIFRWDSGAGGMVTD